MRDFSGKVAVVTGAGSGMGRAFAERLAQEGMRLVLADIETAALEKAVDELRAAGHTAIGVRTDVSDPAAVQALADRAIEEFGKVHVVCNNAGVEGYLDGALWEATDKDWQWTVGVNFWSVVHGIRTFVPLILQHGEDGHVVNTASMTAVTKAGNLYGVTKHAVLALSEVVHKELQARNAPVGVTAICPGMIATNLFHGARNRPTELANEHATPGARQGQEVRAKMHAMLAEGMPPTTVADRLVEGIRADRLYLLTDHDWDEQIRGRNREILGENAELTGAGR